MTMKSMTCTVGVLLALTMTGPAWTADPVKDTAADAVKQQATDAVQDQATEVMKDRARAMMPKVGVTKAADPAEDEAITAEDADGDDDMVSDKKDAVAEEAKPHEAKAKAHGDKAKTHETKAKAHSSVQGGAVQ